MNPINQTARSMRYVQTAFPYQWFNRSDFASLDIGDELRSKIVTASQTIDGIDFLVK